VPKAVANDERVACSSCQFPYARTREFCPMCGTAQPAEAAYPQIVNQESQRPRPTVLASLRGSVNPMLSNRASVLAACIVLTFGIYHWIARPQTVTSSATLSAIKKPVVDSVPPVAQVAQSDQAQGVTNAAIISKSSRSSPRKSEITQDPVELWKNVQHGSTEAEVQLAMMYLDGTQVSQNCEQAHLLLLAAAKKQNARSNDLLSHIYAQRCP
jgi:hypothetical protein